MLKISGKSRTKLFNQPQVQAFVAWVEEEDEEDDSGEEEDEED